MANTPAVDCFEDVNIETVNHCPNDDTVGGLTVDMFYIPVAHIDTFTIPKIQNSTSYADGMTVTAITPKTGKGFKRLSIMMDENEITDQIVGNKGNKKNKVDLDAYLPNFKKENLGFKNRHKNTPMIYAVKDSTGQFWIIGTPNAPALFDTAEGKTGKKIDDNSGVNVKITANTQLWAYDGDIVEL